jgi:outer membrane protein, heavy metal efflux system
LRGTDRIVFSVSLRILAGSSIFALSAVSASAQSLRDAVEAAWQKLPAAQARDARATEIDARRVAANAFSPAPPAIGLEQWNDRPTGNGGFRKFAGDISWQLWLPGQSRRQLTALSAEEAFFEENIRALRLQVAGEVREAHWQVRMAEAEQAIAQRKTDEAATLAADTERRVNAGTLARIDSNQARAAERQARVTLAEASGRLERARVMLRALTGFVRIEGAAETRAPVAPAPESHPHIGALAKSVEAAQAKLAVASGERRDNPEFGIGMFRERSSFTVPFENVVTMRMRIPFATEARNRPRIAAANAEYIEAQATLRRELGRVQAESEAASRELALAQAALGVARERLALTSDSQQLADSAFKLGEYDLPARLRVENERFDAELALARAEIETARLVARLNQAYGLLP